MKPMPKDEIPLTPAGCRAARELIETAELNLRFDEALSAHCRSCADCQRYGQQINNLRQLVAGQARVAAPGDFDFKLRQRIAASKRPAEMPWWQVMRQPALGAAATAMVLLALLVGIDRVHIWQNQPQQPQTANNIQAPTHVNQSGANSRTVDQIKPVASPTKEENVAGLAQPVVARNNGSINRQHIKITPRPDSIRLVYGAQPVVDVVSTDDLDNTVARETSAIF